MRPIKIMLSFFFIFMLAARSDAQFSAAPAEDPTTWRYEVKKMGGNEYALVFHLSLKKGWHIWSLHPGGDGFEIVPSFVFDKNNKMRITDSVQEVGQPITTTMEGIEGKITYLANNVDYVQHVAVTANCRITGTLQYQVCNNNMCLPPKKKTFVFDIKN